MESFYFLEEELITKMHSTFTQRFNLDNYMAAELALEIIDIIKPDDVKNFEKNNHLHQVQW